MDIKSSFISQPRRLPTASSAVTEAPQNVEMPQDSFTFDAAPRHTSLFHRATGFIAGGVAGATAGTMLLGPMGNGIGADGLIYPVIGFIGGGIVGAVAGTVASGKVESTAESTSLLHRANAVVAGGSLGALAGGALLMQAGNGHGAEGLIYPLIGLVAGGGTGALAGGIAAGHFPDSQAK